MASPLRGTFSSFATIIILCLLSFKVALSQNLIIAPACNYTSCNDTRFYFNAPQSDFGNTPRVDVNFTSRSYTLVDIDSPLAHIDTHTRIVFVSFDEVPVDKLLRKVLSQLESKPAAILLHNAEKVAGRAQYYQDKAVDTDTPPVFEVSLGDGGKIERALKDFGSLNATIIGSISNPWRDWFDSPLSWVIQFFGWEIPAFLVLCYIFYQLWYLYTTSQTLLNIPFVVMSLHAWALICVVLSGIDALHRNIYPASLSISILDANFAPTITATVLITLYWHETLSNAGVDVNNFLSKIWVIFAAIRITLQHAIVYILYGAVYMLLCLVILVFYVVTCIRIGIRLKATSSISDSGKSMMKRLIIRMAFIILGYVSFFSGFIIIISGVYGIPWGNTVMSIFFYMFSIIIAAAQVQAFRHHSKNATSGSTIQSKATSSGKCSGGITETPRGENIQTPNSIPNDE